VQIIGRDKIDDACTKHAEWRASLNTWIKIVSEAGWRHFADVRLTFKNADKVGIYVVFNIAQNRGRMIAIINYKDQRVSVLKIVDHAAYDREDFE
jgi:mRNA interferase HigB